MNESRIQSLYDSLYDFESRARPEVYPVHKRLCFDAEAMDIYEWLIDRIDLPTQGRVLDAGCGVGFGTLLLAERCACPVTGISLSDKEVAAARRALSKGNVRTSVEFKRGSFDELPPATFELVVAVESLKHSADLGRSLRSLLRSIKRNGLLVIVEDFARERADGAAARRLQTDWDLQRLYTETDYLAILGEHNCEVQDLTRFVRRAGGFALARRFVLLSALIAIARDENRAALRAFRGGVSLERLYAARRMEYKAIFCRVAEGASC